MRHDTLYGPVWIFPDKLSERVAKRTAQMELMWPNIEGFIAMHTGPGRGGAWLVRAPKAALEESKLKSLSAAEYPVKEGTVWPPIHEETERTLEQEPDHHVRRE